MLKKSYLNFLLTTRPVPKVHRSPVPPWINIAIGEIGQTEISGKEDNMRIVEYLKTVDVPIGDANRDEIPWCSAFVNWVIKKCGYTPTGKALARSWMEWGFPMYEPCFGCITVLKRGTEPWMGHVGLLLDVTKDYIVLLGGNQKNRVGVNVYSPGTVLSYRWPK